jgi:hypothetical protein
MVDEDEQESRKRQEREDEVQLPLLQRNIHTRIHVQTLARGLAQGNLHTDPVAHDLQERTNTPLALVASLARSLSNDTALSDDVAAWLQQPTLRLLGFHPREQLALERLAIAHGEQSDISTHGEHQRHCALLADRVQNRNWVLPTEAVRGLIRTQGDCFPDSIAYLLWCSEPGVKPASQWSAERTHRSKAVRTKLVHWLRNQESTPLPASGQSIPFGLLPRGANESWKHFCDRMETTGAYAEAPMVAAVACVYNVKIDVASSGHQDGTTYYPAANADRCSTFRVAHSAYSQGHFVPAFLAPAPSAAGPDPSNGQARQQETHQEEQARFESEAQSRAAESLASSSSAAVQAPPAAQSVQDEGESVQEEGERSRARPLSCDMHNRMHDLETMNRLAMDQLRERQEREKKERENNERQGQK